MRKDINKPSVMDQVAEDRVRVAEALGKLRNAAGFGEYENTLKELYASLIKALVTTRAADIKNQPLLIYLQAQIELVEYLYSLTMDQVIKNLVNERFADTE